MTEQKDVKNLDPYGIVKLLSELVLNYISLDFLLDKPKIFLWFKLGLLLLVAKISPRQSSCQHLKTKDVSVSNIQDSNFSPSLATLGLDSHLKTGLGR